MKEKLARFMSGRYGVDQLSRLYLGIALILLVVSIFSHLGIFYIAGIVLLVYTYYRMFSKNISKMYAQNQKYLNAKYRAVVKKDAWNQAENKPYELGASTGVILEPIHDVDDIDELMKKADDNMYDCKVRHHSIRARRRV